jgi:glycosyltransferase involved in cell wall biosynthesis
VKLIAGKKYDFIFVCVGYGDEYLLQTALTLSQNLKIPMIVDFRDLWSDHHEPQRFTEKQKKMIRKYEKKLLKNTILISVPQRHMVKLLNSWCDIPVYLLSHSAYKGENWQDGYVDSNEFKMLYAGKIYADGPGLKMLLTLIKELSQARLYKPLKCHFYVDDTVKLANLVKLYEVTENVVINGWISPELLWKELRSAHLLLITDSGAAENYPLLPTKTFQYLYTGRQILCLSRYENFEMKDFLEHQNAGMDTTEIPAALKWVEKLSFQKELYERLPPLRNVALRENVAFEFGKHIESIILKK